MTKNVPIIPPLGKRDQEWVEYIQMCRANNNINWMNILKIALKYAPKKTKKILKEIREMDLRISQGTGRIVDDD